MATGTTKTKELKEKERSTRVFAYDEFVDNQLAKVGSQIKVSDVAGRMMFLAAVVISFVLALVILDHWVMDLGRWGRLAGLVALLGGTLTYGLRVLLPECIRRINPAYSAWIVERSEPSLKSSLINFVLLRPRKEVLPEVVYQEIEKQAARRLSNVEIETAVDQTPLIRVALALLFAVCLFAAYTFLSPKSPFQTIARIAQPFRMLARPSRVGIRDVQPQHVTVYAGRHLDVSAIVENTDVNEPVWLVFSSQDGQLSGERLPMEVDEQGLRFLGRLPAGAGGIELDMSYEIHAGDAVAGPYDITVSDAPSIFVEELIYDFPDYTGIADKSVRDNADIAAVEGTRITIRAKSNQDILHARVEFDPSISVGETPSSRQRLTMKHAGRSATVSFPLTLKADRQTSTHGAYQLRFTAVDNQTNDQPIEHRILVQPDLAPLVEILTPETQSTRVPINAQQLIEIRASDPDFGLQEVWLRAIKSGERMINQSLLSEPATGQQVLTYSFRPQQLGLAVGDIILYQALARDNRLDPVSGEAAPNSVVTERYAIEITAASDNPRDEGQTGLSEDPSSEDEQRDESPTGDPDSEAMSDPSSDQEPAGESETDRSESNDNGTGEQEDGGTGPAKKDNRANRTRTSSRRKARKLEVKRSNHRPATREKMVNRAPRVSRERVERRLKANPEKVVKRPRAMRLRMPLTARRHRPRIALPARGKSVRRERNPARRRVNRVMRARDRSPVQPIPIRRKRVNRYRARAMTTQMRSIASWIT